MICLSKSAEFLSLREISEEEGIPFDYLEKICSKIEKSGIIISKKGVHGGYALARSPKKIKVGEIMKALEGKMVLIECIKGGCPRKKSCRSIRAWKKLQKSIDKTMDSMTLYNLIKE